MNVLNFLKETPLVPTCRTDTKGMTNNDTPLLGQASLRQSYANLARIWATKNVTKSAA